MRIIETKVYKYEELNSDAKEKARDWWRDCENRDSSFSENVIEDAATIAELFGLDIRTRRAQLMGGEHRYEPVVYFRGFWSQGDGACFEGEYRYKPGALKAVKAYAPQDTELHNIVQILQGLQKKNFYRVACRTHSGHYYHSGCMRVDCENTYDNRDVIDEDGFIQCMRDFADWIYRRLEEEYDYRMSDEQVEEAVIMNEYEFTEEGGLA